MAIHSLFSALLGGALIGVAVTLMLLFNGRVTGISGIVASSLTKPSKDGIWRWMFLVGMVFGGALVQILRPELLQNRTERGVAFAIGAGLLVGYGTVMGSGCTSGHGVCGISRFSVRSTLATVTFMVFGFLVVQVMRIYFGGQL